MNNSSQFETEWLAGLPEEWIHKRADFLCNPYRITVDPSNFGDELVAHYSIPQVQETGGPAIEPASDIDSNKLWIIQPSVLVSKLNPRKKTVCIAEPHADYETVASSEFVSIQSSAIDRKYAYYLWCSEKVTDRLSALVQSVTRSHQRVNPSEIQKLPWKWPPLATQRRIARFLDEKTARIDALIEKKRALLERLSEKRQALITRAVTKGLDPNAPMKPSGIHWLGEIPAHWEVKRLRFLAKLISGSTPTTSVPEYWNGDIPWICPKDMKTEEIYDSQEKLTDYAVEDYGVRLHSQDNAVIVVRGMILARKVPVAVARGKYTINQDMKAVQSRGEVLPEFIQMYLNATESWLFTLVAEAGHGTKALRTDVLLDTPVLVPPFDEQRDLVTSMTKERNMTDRAVNKISRSISTLAEYRSTLITAAVTGQIAELNG